MAAFLIDADNNNDSHSNDTNDIDDSDSVVLPVYNHFIIA